MRRGDRWRLAFFVALGGLLLAGAGMYFLNPFGTASDDPRARIFGYTPYRIPSTAMAPTLQPGDFILAHAGAYRTATPAPGDVIVFLPPHQPGQTWIKRVAGGPGDRVAIRAGVLYRNGLPIDEPYVDRAALRIDMSRELAEIHVPPDQLFVLGDNRDNSEDGRYWGTLPVDRVVGRAVMIWYSEQPGRTGEIQ